MNLSRLVRQIFSLLILTLFTLGCSQAAKEIERPEKIVSKRQVIYETETYQKLAKLWEDYYDAFPSEDAYANWMYAARYAGDENYGKLLEKGYNKYPSNPTILYLYGMNKYEHNSAESLRLMEKAVRLDPSYMDPWFDLVIKYMLRNDEKLDVALRHLLDGGVISDEVMDYNYNMLASLAKNAILITNGDNDTYPGWILTRILKYRPDVTIVNRSLLNTDWYPVSLVEQGMPKFITRSKLEELRKEILNDYKTKGKSVPPAGPFGDTLIVRIIESAGKEGRPVYFAATLYSSEVIDRYLKDCRCLGLVSLVTPTEEPYSDQVKTLLNIWFDDFRTGGLGSWKLQYSAKGDAGRMLISNYAASMEMLMEPVKNYAPQYRLKLFDWYQTHLNDLLSDTFKDKMDQMWRSQKDVESIQEWYRRQGFIE